MRLGACPSPAPALQKSCKKRYIETIKKQKRQTKGYINEVMRWGINEAKWKAAERFCDNNAMKFVILTEKELNINP